MVQMRFTTRRCVTLVLAFILIVTLSLYTFQSRVETAVSGFEFLENALHHTGGRFHEAHDDGTGGWLTRWFTPTTSRARFLGHTQRQPQSALRCAVYTYIDTSLHRRGSDEFAILQTWMRSFGALGFRPVVLTDKDAKRHPRYNSLRSQGLLASSSSGSLGKWLAMAQHGGLFVDYRTIPMPNLENRYFANLQRCEFTQLTIHQPTGDHVVHGARQAFELFIQYIVDNPSRFDSMSTSRPLSEIARSQFNVQPSLDGFATYSEEIVADLFPGLKSNLLSHLINAHLHEHFIREHSVLAIIDPIPDTRLNLFRHQITSLANIIAQCPSSPVAGSCPPGLGVSRCKPCNSASVLRYRTLTNIPPNSYILTAVPHPYTFLSYVHQKSSLDARFVRDSEREEWISSVTAGVVDRRTGGYQRIQTLKEFINSDSAIVFSGKLPSGIWQTWEELDLEGLESMLGFQIETLSEPNEKDSNSVTSDANAGLPKTKERVLAQASESGRDMVESWNLAWTELWYYLRALQRHRKSEHLDIVGSFSF